jgi:hypothetical protein
MQKVQSNGCQVRDLAERGNRSAAPKAFATGSFHRLAGHGKP